MTVNLRKMRVAMGWSQQHLASKVGVSRSTITLLENGSKTGSVALWDRIEQVLDVPQQWLRKKEVLSVGLDGGTD
jgi:transcriptional regulator with XRE-family HTH domain